MVKSTVKSICTKEFTSAAIASLPFRTIKRTWDTAYIEVTDFKITIDDTMMHVWTMQDDFALAVVSINHYRADVTMSFPDKIGGSGIDSFSIKPSRASLLKSILGLQTKALRIEGFLLGELVDIAAIGGDCEKGFFFDVRRYNVHWEYQLVD